MKGVRLLIFALVFMCALSNLTRLSVQAETDYEVGQDYSLHTAANYGKNEWVSSNTGVVQITGMSGQYCYIECVSVGTAYVTNYVRYSVPTYDPVTKTWFLLEHLDKYYTYTINVRSPQCILINSSKTDTTAGFTFDAPTGATSVKIQQSSDGGSSWENASTNALNESSTTATVTGLSPNTAYKFKVSVVGGKRSGDSNIVSLTTLAKVSGIHLDQTSLTLTRGQTGMLKATLLPNNVYNTKLTWHSSNENIIAVTNNNDLTATLNANANMTGNAIVTVTTIDGGFSAECNVKVINPTVAKPVSSASGGIINIGTKVSLFTQTTNAAIYFTLDGTTPTIDSTKYSQPIVINNSLTLKAIGICSNMYDSDVLSVDYTAVVGVTKVAFDKPLVSVPNGDTTPLAYEISPSNAYNKGVTFLSGDMAIATVDSNGVITGKKVGTTTLTIQTVDGGFTDKCIINVIPKPITTAADFVKIGVTSDFLNSYSYKLMADIDLSGFETSYSNRSFVGIFDGGGHTISNVKSNLFKSNSGEIKNLKVSGNIVVNDNSPYHQDQNYGVIANINLGIISNCVSTVQMSVSLLASSDTTYQLVDIGGIVGFGSNVYNCVNNGNIIVVDNHFRHIVYIGGITGSGKNITDCANNGNITLGNSTSRAACDQFAYIGGIAGYCDSTGNIERCCNYGNLLGMVQATGGYSGMLYVSRANSFVGGICGSGGVISKSYNCGSITATAYAYPDDLGRVRTFEAKAYSGGIIGKGGSANDCYNIGRISATAANEAKTIGIASTETNSYCLNNVVTGGSSAITKTEAELKQQSTYSGFDFVSVWGINSSKNNGYPYLLNNGHIIKVNEITMNKLVINAQTGQTEQLIATVGPVDATDKDVIWSVYSGENVVSISSTGLVSALNPGTAVVRAISKQTSDVYAECIIYVTKALVMGDLNGDDIITKADAVMMKNYLLGIMISDQSMNLSSGDLDGDGRITSKDYALLLRNVP